MPFGQGRSGGARRRGGDEESHGDKEKGQRRPMFRRRKVCKFCADKIDDINYKDVKLLGPVRARARQDSAAADFRHLRHAPAQAADGDQARPADRWSRTDGFSLSASCSSRIRLIDDDDSDR